MEQEKMWWSAAGIGYLADIGDIKKYTEGGLLLTLKDDLIASILLIIT